MKIFGIGLARTGNASLCAALNILGYNCIHFPRTIQEIDYHAAAVDTSVAVGYKFLDMMFPGAKFILTVRERDAWLASCERYWAEKHRVQDEFMANVHRILYGSEQFDAGRFNIAMDRHAMDVIEHFRGRACLLTYPICAGAGWEPLCSFLEKSVPDAPFPREHVRC